VKWYGKYGNFLPIFSQFVHYSSYLSSIFTISFHYSTYLSSIFSLSFPYSTYFSFVFSKSFQYSSQVEKWKDMKNMEKKVSWIVKWYGKYGRKVS
jgi:hypothetical protein